MSALAPRTATLMPRLRAWVAECDERHVGLAVCRVPDLPHVGRGLPELLAVEALGAPGPEPAEQTDDNGLIQ